MSNSIHSLVLIAVMAGLTAMLRFLPFLVFRKHTPGPVLYLGRVLPYAIMGMLVVYCLKDLSFRSAPFGAPEIIGCAVVAGLHVWKRNMLLSIGGGTICYMLLVQLVF